MENSKAKSIQLLQLLQLQFYFRTPFLDIHSWNSTYNAPSDGVAFCDTLEPTDRHLEAATMRPEQKVFGQTAIPTGTYPVVLTYSPRFKCTLPLLKNVPHFEGIRIHVGNTSKDTKGCILVGEYRCKGLIVRSRITLNRLMERLEECPEEDPITLEVVSS